MKTLCGTDCCNECLKYKNECAGCIETNGHPCGGDCVAAECLLHEGFTEYVKLKDALIQEVNELGLPHLHIEDLNLLNGDYINLPYPDNNGQSFYLLKNNCVYLANQVEIPDSELCYGIACNAEIIVISKYGCNGSNPELVLYKKRLSK